jgi:hypothetical protein
MRKFLVTLIAVATLGAGTALAQGGMWAGLSTGYPFGATLHFGMEDLISPGVDVRFNFRGNMVGDSAANGGYTATWGGLAFGVGADVLYSLSDLAVDSPVEPYVGGGLSLGLVSGSGTINPGNTPFAVSGLGWDLHGLVGAEYIFADHFGVFGEGQLGYGGAATAALDPTGHYIAQSGSGPTFALRLGVNYHF